MLLNHTAGVPAFAGRSSPVPSTTGAAWSRRWRTRSPLAISGERVGYHSFNIGWLGGEIVRRVDGRPFDRFFSEEIAEPLRLDFWFGVPSSDESRVAKMLPIVDHPFQIAVEFHPESIAAMQVLNSGGFVQNEEHNLLKSRRACLPAQGGITNARGLAGMYAPLSLGGSLGTTHLVEPETVRLMGTVNSSTECDSGAWEAVSILVRVHEVRKLDHITVRVRASRSGWVARFR